MKKRLAFLTLCLLMTASLSYAEGKQKLTINGEIVEQTVSRITFDGDNVVLHFVSGTDLTADMESVVLGFEFSTTTSVYSLRGTVGDSLNLSGLDDGCVVSVYDAQGKIVARTAVVQSKAVLPTSSLKSGVYMLKAGNQVVKFVKR